jgi:hypothetical protein
LLIFKDRAKRHDARTILNSLSPFCALPYPLALPFAAFRAPPCSVWAYINQQTVFAQNSRHLPEWCFDGGLNVDQLGTGSGSLVQ